MDRADQIGSAVAAMAAVVGLGLTIGAGLRSKTEVEPPSQTGRPVGRDAAVRPGITILRSKGVQVGDFNRQRNTFRWRSLWS